MSREGVGLGSIFFQASGGQPFDAISDVRVHTELRRPDFVLLEERFFLADVIRLVFNCPLILFFTIAFDFIKSRHSSPASGICVYLTACCICTQRQFREALVPFFYLKSFSAHFSYYDFSPTQKPK
jgi:hypothetical protein